jgi:hypothetical protein
MKRKIGVIFLLSAIFVGIVFGSAWWLGRKNSTNKQATMMPVISPTPARAVEKIWDDPAGFTFRYDENLAIDKHDEDKENYAHLELTHPAHPGSIIVWVTDTTAQDSDSWVKTEKTFTGANIIDTTLGDQPAKKVVVPGVEKKIVTGSIYDGLLWYAEGLLGTDPYWTDQYALLLDSWVFKPAPTLPAAPAVQSVPAVGAGLEEEVLE